MHLPGILIDLMRIAVSSQPLYLVGGAVRDYLLGRPCRDYDIVCARDVHSIARKFVDQTKGAIYTLDGERKTYRVLVGQGIYHQVVIDFATMQGDSIDEDLAQRDFTINAMAVALDEPDKILDPNKGGRDLQERFLRPVSVNSFNADPLRVIRAMRYAVDLDLKIEAETSALMRDTVSGLMGVSKERKRDELFRILDGRNIHTALLILQHFHVFDFIPLQLKKDFSQVLSESRELEELLGWVTGGKVLEKQAALYQVAIFMQLGRFKENIRNHYFTDNTAGRTRKALLFLTLLVGMDPVATRKVNLEKLALSVDEVTAIECFYSGYTTCCQLFDAHKTPSPVEIFDYFQKAGSSGIDLVFSNLARYRARIGVEFSHDEWLRRISIAETLLDAWWEKPDIVQPEPLLNGNEIMQVSRLTPGPIIGVIIDALVHQQVAGVVTTKKQAINWLARWLHENEKR